MVWCAISRRSGSEQSPSPTPTRMLKVALTGNIASGKSTVADVWRDLGATVIDADQLAREAVAPGSVALRKIAERWGPGILLPSGELDRAALRDVVFRDPEERHELEKIVHPEVNRLRVHEMERARIAGKPIVVADIPLLFEAGLNPEFDRIVLVDAPEESRLRRLLEERGMERAEAERMVASQWPSSRKKEASDIVIDNSATLEEVQRRASEVWKILEKSVAR